jgi:hypothetical protein
MDAVSALASVFSPVSPKSGDLIEALAGFGRIAQSISPDDPVSIVRAAAIMAEKAAADAKYGKG